MKQRILTAVLAAMSFVYLAQLDCPLELKLWLCTVLLTTYLIGATAPWRHLWGLSYSVQVTAVSVQLAMFAGYLILARPAILHAESVACVALGLYVNLLVLLFVQFYMQARAESMPGRQTEEVFWAVEVEDTDEEQEDLLRIFFGSPHRDRVFLAPKNWPQS